MAPLGRAFGEALRGSEAKRRAEWPAGLEKFTVETLLNSPQGAALLSAALEGLEIEIEEETKTDKGETKRVKKTVSVDENKKKEFLQALMKAKEDPNSNLLNAEQIEIAAKAVERINEVRRRIYETFKPGSEFYMNLSAFDERFRRLMEAMGIEKIIKGGNLEDLRMRLVDALTEVYLRDPSGGERFLGAYRRYEENLRQVERIRDAIVSKVRIRENKLEQGQIKRMQEIIEKRLGEAIREAQQREETEGIGGIPKTEPLDLALNKIFDDLRAEGIIRERFIEKVGGRIGKGLEQNISQLKEEIKKEVDQIISGEGEVGEKFRRFAEYLVLDISLLARTITDVLEKSESELGRRLVTRMFVQPPDEALKAEGGMSIMEMFDKAKEMQQEYNKDKTKNKQNFKKRFSQFTKQIGWGFLKLLLSEGIVNTLEGRGSSRRSK